MIERLKHGNASLVELEPDVRGEPDFGSHLVTECHRLRRVQLRLLTPENLRMLIGQQIGLPFLVPMALDLLKANPLAEGDFFPGDLLCAVLKADANYWRANTTQKTVVHAIALRTQGLAETHNKVVRKALAAAFDDFLNGDHGSNKALERSARGRTRASQQKQQGPRRPRAGAQRGR